MIQNKCKTNGAGVKGGNKMLWINGKMTDLTKKDAIHKLVDAKCFLERYSNPHDKWTEAINIGIEAIEIVMAQEEQEGRE